MSPRKINGDALRKVFSELKTGREQSTGTYLYKGYRVQISKYQSSGTERSAQLYRKRKGNHVGKPSGRYKTVVLERAYRSGWEVYESICRGTVDAAGNPLTFG